MLTDVLPAVESNLETQNRDKILSDSPNKFRDTAVNGTADTFGMLV